MALPVNASGPSRQLIQAYLDGWDRIVAELEDIARDPSAWRRREKLTAALRAVQEILSELDQAAVAYAQREVGRLYGIGAVEASVFAGTEFVWSQIDRDAVNELAQGLTNNLLAANDRVEESTKVFLRGLARNEALQKLIQGTPALRAGDLMAAMGADRVHAIEYRDGTMHSLREYSRMVIRTTTALAYNQGVLNSSASDTEFYEVFDGPTCGWNAHNDPEPAAGRIVSKQEAMGHLISHPNCRRAFGPRPDLTAPAPASAGLGSVTPDQMADVRAADANRAAGQARRARTAQAASERAQRLSRRAAILAARRG